MASTLLTRDATPADAAACAALYAPYVLQTAVSFETEPPAAEEMARRIAAAQERYAWLVGEHDGVVAGYAYAGSWRSRAAYARTAETSIYVAQSATGTGVGSVLYRALLERLGKLGLRTVVAGMTLPNPASEALHTALGFMPVGVFRRVGWKHGAWHDVSWMQLDLSAASGGTT
ncbi:MULTISPECIES: GNAT family N-acetyltransferase [Arthrobacter]|uniref:GNAT family N-acetyltransferase n=1 Tax=Arthrobacter TaxID=1663 RepID=UPI001D1468A3|nr:MULTISPECIES: GNAT family N-acetyltransferase [Arthrobacter]MCC3282036.1 N-acetyltransferase family protein [Arthrobacter caoxuetaonis]MCC9194477.1 N-acetyltransferase family protein [Arthrobacter sp. zg-Y916]